MDLAPSSPVQCTPTWTGSVVAGDAAPFADPVQPITDDEDDAVVMELAGGSPPPVGAVVMEVAGGSLPPAQALAMQAVDGGVPHATATLSIQESLEELLCLPLQTPLIRGPPRLRRPRTPVFVTPLRRSERIAAQPREADTTRQA
jgi:hypothetical protein